MTRRFIAVCMLMTSVGLRVCARPHAQENGGDPGGHCAWLAERVNEIEKIKVGMTRPEVEKLLTVDEGGFPLRKSVRYQNRKCEYIKLDVTYKVAKAIKTADGSENDTVLKITSPLLDLVPNRARW